MNEQDSQFVERIIKEAGKRLVAYRGNVKSIMQKGDNPRNEVTAADLEIHTMLVEALQKEYPSYAVASEEAAEIKGSGAYSWTVDPIDGTSNFARDIPHFSVCVGLVHNGKPVLGGIYNPITDEYYSFTESFGAALGSHAIRTSSVKDAADAQILFHVGRNESYFEWGTAVMGELLRHTKKVKDFGSSGLDLCFLANGRVDAVVYGTLTTRDIASAVGVVRAAGGETYNMRSLNPVEISAEPQPIVATANPALLESLEPFLRRNLLP